MMWRPTKARFYYLVLILLFAFACTQEKKPRSTAEKLQIGTPANDYISQIIAFDTLSSAQVKTFVNQSIEKLSTAKNKETQPYYYFFLARKFQLNKNRDSAVIMLDSMVVPNAKSEIYFLKNISLLDQGTNGGEVSAVIMDNVLALAESAEKTKSKFTYRVYDVLAKAYYQNRDEKTSSQYVEKYFEAHPFKNHPIIKQRYFDISFLLASRANDFNKMLKSNEKARNFAISIKDSLAIARTYDNEAQIYDRKMDFPKALACSRIYINYLRKSNNLNDIAYNNLATSFNSNNLPDSAIFYYQQAIKLSEQTSPGKPKYVYYKGMIDAYKQKGDYKTALQMAEKANADELEAIKQIESVKVAEIKEKYETEKKDRNISELLTKNQLNEQVIKQQRTTMLLASLVFFAVIIGLYLSYRQRQLKQNNNLLKSENKRLSMEQKLLQVQLNPHFIFNSIANLQSLVATGNIKETVRYLTVFSGLLRNVLEQSRKDFITLEEEIISLENYLQLQQMRFVGLFDYKIKTADNLYITNTLIPPMLIQPFVENAIEHGFRNIDYKGLLTINFSVKNEQLIVVIEDDGKGISTKSAGDQKKQSLAGTILKERLDLVFNSQGQDAKFEQKDKKEIGEHGYTVCITIPELKD